MQPDDRLVGGDALRYKCIHNDTEYLVYLANPSGTTPKSDYPKGTVPTITLKLPKYTFSVRWFDPDTGTWVYDSNILGTEVTKLTAPAEGDWVLWLSRK
ncbi:MAG: putative collagen-binding domain-containing protein [Bacteroidota bacterium]